jgi:hypothetical protein
LARKHYYSLIKLAKTPKSSLIKLAKVGKFVQKKYNVNKQINKELGE